MMMIIIKSQEPPHTADPRGCDRGKLAAQLSADHPLVHCRAKPAPVSFDRAKRRLASFVGSGIITRAKPCGYSCSSDADGLRDVRRRVSGRAGEDGNPVWRVTPFAKSLN